MSNSLYQGLAAITVLLLTTGFTAAQPGEAPANNQQPDNPGEDKQPESVGKDQGMIPDAAPDIGPSLLPDKAAGQAVDALGNVSSFLTSSIPDLGEAMQDTFGGDSNETTNENGE